MRCKRLAPWGFALALATVGAPSMAFAALVSAIEFYNVSLERYFLTAFADEVELLDAGAIPGWSRTGPCYPLNGARVWRP